MAEMFDPYYIWLGIPPEEQPADHYRLLGIRRFETNEEVIANAADQRARHLRSMQTGKRQAESQRLLNEIAVVAAVLLDVEKRREYDTTLHALPVAGKPASRPLPLRPVQTPSTASPVSRGVSIAAPPNRDLTRWLAIGGVASVRPSWRR